MRIIAGKYRGKKLFSPTREGVRPTSDRAREALFSVLYSRFGGFSGLSVIDIFAGTGAFGLEALSRGAEKALLIDKDTALATKNAALFPDFKQKLEVLRADACHLPYAKQTYNLVFCDAPYAKGLTEPALTELAKKSWLLEGAFCMVEVRKDEALTPPLGFCKTDEKIYGLAKVIFLTFDKKIVDI